MSASGREFTDDALNRVLDRWLDGGPTTMPDDSIGNALRAVAVTPQRRWRGRLVRFSGASPLVPVGLTLAGVAAVVALGIGLGSLLPPAGTPTPEVSTTPAPSAEPSDAAGERLVRYTNSEDGYELVLPESWAASARRIHAVADGSATVVPGVTRIARHVWSMTISIGTADGTVSVCDRAGLCQPVVVKTLDELDRAVVSSPVDRNGTVAVDEVSLGGEVGRLEYPRTTCTVDLCTIAGRGGHWLFSPSTFPGTRTVVAIHNGRPVILQFEWFSSSLDEVQAIIDSFRYLDDEPTPAPGSMTTFTNDADRYQLLLPATWVEGPVPSADQRPGVMTFGKDDTTFLTIRIGDPNGVIYLCRPAASRGPLCADAIVTTLDDFAGALVSGPDQGQMPSHHITEIQEDTILGGEPAMVERFDAGAYSSGPPAFYHVFAIHEGRPVVLEFNYWLAHRGKIPELAQIIANFRFLD